jgi:hypothetical protein
LAETSGKIDAGQEERKEKKEERRIGSRLFTPTGFYPRVNQWTRFGALVVIVDMEIWQEATRRAIRVSYLPIA